MTEMTKLFPYKGDEVCFLLSFPQKFIVNIYNGVRYLRETGNVDFSHHDRY